MLKLLSTNQLKIAIIGAGNISKAMTGGFINSKLFKPSQITVTDINDQKLIEVHEEYGVQTTKDNLEAIK